MLGYLKYRVNPHLNKDYFVSRKLKLWVKKLTSIAKNVRDKANNICKLETMTLKNNGFGGSGSNLSFLSFVNITLLNSGVLPKLNGDGMRWGCMGGRGAPEILLLKYDNYTFDPAQLEMTEPFQERETARTNHHTTIN